MRPETGQASMAVLLALGAATAWGASDFIAGHAVRRITARTGQPAALPVAILSQAVALPAAAAAALLIPGIPRRADMTAGAVAGVGAGIGVALLYWALARGPWARSRSSPRWSPRRFPSLPGW